MTFVFDRSYQPESRRFVIGKRASSLDCNSKSIYDSRQWIVVRFRSEIFSQPQDRSNRARRSAQSKALDRIQRGVMTWIERSDGYPPV
jgi:hypothetical protein